MKNNIKYTHPNLYNIFFIFALINIALGVNFFFTNPTFNPYGYAKEITGSIFLIIGIAQVIFLVFYNQTKVMRSLIAFSLANMLYWGVGTSFTFFTGQTSLQLFVLYGGLALLQYFLLREPYINPVTQVKNGVT